jgi:phosphohistidine phosphatase SixA
MGVEILVVQHGEKVRSAGDPGLTDEGHEQAAVVAMWLAENRPDVEAIVASLRLAIHRSTQLTASSPHSSTSNAAMPEWPWWSPTAGSPLTRSARSPAMTQSAKRTRI